MTDIHTLYGLVFDCPRSNRKDDCPKKHVGLPIKRKGVMDQWFEQRRKEIILEHHKACSIKRQWFVF